jgi:hypothetical protein
VGFGKTGGNWRFQVGQELVDAKYNINDMGILFNNNYLDHFLWTSYRWVKPKNWYNRVQVNFNAYYSRLFTPMPDQKIGSQFQMFQTNINANAQFKNLWFVGALMGYVPEGNDFYEPHVPGRSFRSPQRKQFSLWGETNEAKKYYVELNSFLGVRSLFNSPNLELNFSHRYRFSDKFSLTQDLNYNPSKNDAGFYDFYYAPGTSSLQDVLFSRRNRQTVENVIKAKYNFNNRSGITFRARHYWSKVTPQQLYDLQADGTLLPTSHNDAAMLNTNYNIFNIDAVYTLQFAPGSFINIVWKNAIETADQLPNQYAYFKNIDETLQAPQNNNFSIKVLYYLDYLDLKKWRKKRL